MNARILTMLAAALALLLSGCSNDTPSPPSETPAAQNTDSAAAPTSGASPSAATPSNAGNASSSTATSSSSTPSVKVITATSGEAAFITPSGGIRCLMQKGYIRCDVQDPTYTIPPRPKNCEFDYGYGIKLEGGKAALSCVSDAIPTDIGQDYSQWWNQSPKLNFKGAAALPYGYALRLGSVRCESQKAGVTCRDSQNGGAFFLSRERYDLNPG